MEERHATRSMSRVVVQGDGTLNLESQRFEREAGRALAESVTLPGSSGSDPEVVEETPEAAQK